MGKFNVISADSHVYEPGDLWNQYMTGPFRERAPRIVSQGGKDVFIVDGLPPNDVGLVVAAGKRFEDIKVDARFEEGRPGGWDPQARVKDMDVDNIDAEVLYPSLCMRLWQVPDAQYQLACMQAYNDWMADFVAGAPGRLIGVGLVPLRDIDAGVAELRRIARKGLRGACITAVAPPDRPYSHPGYDPFWAAAEETGLPLSLHVHTGTRAEMDYPEDFIASYAMFPRWIQGSLALMITSGALERFPRLKIITVEIDIGWIGTFLRRLDHAYERHRHWSGAGKNLRMYPSEYFKRQVYATFMDDEAGIKSRHESGVNNIMWSSDYPHSDSTWPHSSDVIGRLFKDVSADERHRIVYQNAAELYRVA